MYDHEFAVCLTHDVDRVHRTFQGPYYALTQKRLNHLTHYVTNDRPYWQFEKIMTLEDELNVRSAFYFLNEKSLFREKHPREWIRPENWVLYTGRYDISKQEIIDVIHALDSGGWEVGLHGSYDSYRDPNRLRKEKNALESILGHEIIGGRQHYLNLKIPTTWEYQMSIGLRYDASLGSSTEYGFQFGYDIRRPFNDNFAVFPLTVMDVALSTESGPIGNAWSECEQLLEEAQANDAVMTILWHPRYFNELEFPGFADLYRRIVERAIDMGAWVGPPGVLYEEIVAKTKL